MGHAAHFLQRLDRVTRSQTELALGLYRDHEAVKHVLARADLPESASRVALAIGDAQRGPFVIVTRDGRFVTCLGEGMSPGKWPVVPRAALDASLAHAADMRRRHQMAAAIARPFEDDIDILLRINQRKNMLSREEIVGISAFAPIFGHTLYQVLAKQSLELVNDAIGCRQPTKSGAEAHARTVWGCAYAMELCGTVEERALLSTTSEIGKVASFSMPLTYLMDHTFVLALRAIRYTHGPKRSSSRSSARPRCMRRKTSCTMSSTSADDRTRRATNGRSFASTARTASRPSSRAAIIPRPLSGSRQVRSTSCRLASSPRW